jgi:hypothetical protein
MEKEVNWFYLIFFWILLSSLDILLFLFKNLIDFEFFTNIFLKLFLINNWYKLIKLKIYIYNYKKEFNH